MASEKKPVKKGSAAAAGKAGAADKRTAAQKAAGERGTAATGSSAGKAPSPDAEAMALLRKELSSLARGMVLEDLSFMVRQAKVLLHNRATEALEAELAAEYERPGSIAEARGPRRAVAITRSASGNANLSLGGDFKLLTPEELAALARIAIDSTSREDRLDRMYRWLDRERRDILHDGGITRPASPVLGELLSAFESAFASKKK